MNSAARAAILQAARQNAPGDVPLPAAMSGMVYADPVAQFVSMVEAIGGRAWLVTSDADANARLHESYSPHPERLRLSRVPGVGDTTLDPQRLTVRDEIAKLDLAILPGHLGVAENGAVWITETSDLAVAAYFACEHLVLVIEAATIVHNMHQAYEQIATRGLNPCPGFATFIAGPSKTADIEQSLVIGAQGPRSLVVLVRS